MPKWREHRIYQALLFCICPFAPSHQRTSAWRLRISPGHVFWFLVFLFRFYMSDRLAKTLSDSLNKYLFKDTTFTFLSSSLVLTVKEDIMVKGSNNLSVKLSWVWISLQSCSVYKTLASYIRGLGLTFSSELGIMMPVS